MTTTHDFNIGDRVRCINANKTGGELITGVIYTVSGIELGLRAKRLQLKEKPSYLSFYQDRFYPANRLYRRG